MIKKVIALVVTSSIISAGLLYLGITLMSQYTPAHASPMNALVAKANITAGSDPTANKENTTTSKVDLPSSQPAGPGTSVSVAQSSAELAVVSSSSSSPAALSARPPTISGATNPASIPVPGTTIADLLKNPKQYEGLLVMITGIATVLNEESILLNDGTGQIMIKVEDDLSNLPQINGQSISVTGKILAKNNLQEIVFRAYSLTDQNGTTITDDCPDDDASTGYDDCIDSIDDDCQDDLDEDDTGSDDDSNDTCDDDDCCDDSGSDDDPDESDDTDDSSDDDVEDDEDGVGEED